MAFHKIPRKFDCPEIASDLKTRLLYSDDIDSGRDPGYRGDHGYPQAHRLRHPGRRDQTLPGLPPRRSDRHRRRSRRLQIPGAGRLPSQKKRRPMHSRQGHPCRGVPGRRAGAGPVPCSAVRRSPGPETGCGPGQERRGLRAGPGTSTNGWRKGDSSNPEPHGHGQQCVAPQFLEFIGMQDERCTVGRIFYLFNIMDPVHRRYQSKVAFTGNVKQRSSQAGPGTANRMRFAGM